MPAYTHQRITLLEPGPFYFHGLTTLAKVEFFANGNLIQTVTTSPYTFNWTPPLAGSYALTGIATDNLGQIKTSSNTRTLNVLAAPTTVTVTSPTAGQVVNAGITLTASVYDTTAAITEVKFYQGATLIGTGTLQSNDEVGTSVYAYTWSSPAAGTYSITAKSTDSAATTTSSAVSMRVNAAPGVTLTSPATGASFTAPATVSLAATASDTDGTIAKVEFFQGATLIATVTSSPYQYSWTGVAQGTYSVTAKATDNDGGVTTSTAANITVNSGVAQLYFIHTDHLNTPRMIADQSQTTVWKWEQAEPFGDSAPIEDPDGNSQNFEFNLRFPGQYFDKVTGLSYNYFRDYDPGIGRYVESDPIGLRGGPNTYAYVGNDPLSGVDPLGLVKVYGNWCGPDWTGGYRKEWNQLTANEQQRAKPPVGPIDVSCMKHDKCYASCRAGLPCNRDGRSACFGDCDLTLYGEVYSQGFTGYAVGTAMGRGGKRDPGPNATNCPNCGKQ